MTASDENGGKFSASACPAHRCVRLLLSGFQPANQPAARIWSQVTYLSDSQVEKHVFRHWGTLITLLLDVMLKNLCPQRVRL